jgi:hypothetical protein
LSGAEEIYVAYLHYLLRGETGSLSVVEAYLGRDSDVIETVLGYSRVDDLRLSARAGSRTTSLSHGHAILPARGVLFRAQAPACRARHFERLDDQIIASRL